MGRPDNVEGCGSCRDTGYCRFIVRAGVMRESLVVPDVADLAERQLIVDAQIAQIQQDIASLAQVARNDGCPNVAEVLSIPVTQ